MKKTKIAAVLCASIILVLGLFAVAGCNRGGDQAPAEPEATESPSGLHGGADQQSGSGLHGGTGQQTQSSQPSEADQHAEAIAAAEAEGKIVVTGTCHIYTAEELCDIADIDPALISGPDGVRGFAYAVVQFSEPTTLNVAASGDMGNLRSDSADMVAVAISEPAWEHYAGDLSFWEPFDGQTVTVALVPEDTWWPSDVRLPLGQPSTSVAELLFVG